MEKEVAIIHLDLTLKGGGERVCVSLIEALNRRGIIPEVYTFYSVNEADLGKYYGKNVKFRTRPLLPFDLKTFGKYTPIIASLNSSFIKHFDIVINTGIFLQPSLKFLIKKYLCYVYTAQAVFYASEKYRRDLLWRLYLLPQQTYMKKSISLLSDDELLAVSNFTKMRIKKYWNKESTTVYPPVDLEKFSEANTNNLRDGVIAIGRFGPEKNYRTQLEMAEKFPEITFRLCGSANTLTSINLFKEIKKQSEEMNLKNVEFYPNIALHKLIDLISVSKYFLHTAVDEDFGLTPCEAISGGCIPLIHNSGGNKETVPYRELRFNDVLEAEKRLRTLMKSDTNDLLNALQNHVNDNFSESIFQKRIMDRIFN